MRKNGKILNFYGTENQNSPISKREEFDEYSICSKAKSISMNKAWF